MESKKTNQSEIKFEGSSADFMNDTTNQVLLLRGCVNSGKTCASLFKIWSSLFESKPGYDGKKRARWLVARNTLSIMQDSTINTWHQLFGKKFGSFFGNKDNRPHFFYEDDKYELEVLFFGLDSMVDEPKLKSLELTGVYYNEVQFLKSERLFERMFERCNRYPSSLNEGGGLGRRLVLLDCNPPDESHWIYKRFEIRKPPDHKVYAYPPALVKATIKKNLTRKDYAIDASGQLWINNKDAFFLKYSTSDRAWLDAAEQRDPTYIKNTLCGEYGIIRTGEPVHNEYADHIHFAKDNLDYISDYPIVLGIDLGNTPACAVTQAGIEGEVNVLHEFATKNDFLRPFMERLVIPFLNQNYPNWKKNHIAIFDPAGLGSTIDSRNAKKIFSEMGIKAKPCVTNGIEYRRDCLKYYLTRIYSGKASFQLNRTCHVLRAALSGEFQYGVIDKDTGLITKTPVKNFHSHVTEALEYACSYHKDPGKYAKVDTYELTSDRISQIAKVVKFDFYR